MSREKKEGWIIPSTYHDRNWPQDFKKADMKKLWEVFMHSKVQMLSQAPDNILSTEQMHSPCVRPQSHLCRHIARCWKESLG